MAKKIPPTPIDLTKIDWNTVRQQALDRTKGMRDALRQNPEMVLPFLGPAGTEELQTLLDQEVTKLETPVPAPPKDKP